MIFSLSTVLVSLGFYLWYCTSERIKSKPISALESYGKIYKTVFKLIGTIAFLGAAALLIKTHGLASGLLYFSIFLMALPSLIIILKPLQLLNKVSITFIIVIITCLEFLYHAS